MIVTDLVAMLAAQKLPDTDIYVRSLGAFPPLVHEALTAVNGNAHTGPDDRRPQQPSVADQSPWENDELDPVDAQWYFDLPSVRRIISHFPFGTRSLLALGVPTVAAVAASSVAEVTLVDISQRFWSSAKPAWLDVSRVERVLHDLDDKRYDGVSDADVVVMDPPWYMENYRAWLSSAIMACCQDGLLAVVLPQILTNRRSFPERQEILGLLENVGPVTIKHDELAYVTPSFEKAVLKTDGLEHLRRWRRADLALVEVRKRRVPRYFPRFAGNDWKYREIEGLVVRSWSEARATNAPPVLEPPGSQADYRLTGVGRSYLWSNNANLVTSHGRGATVQSWGALPRVLDLCQEGYDLESAVKMALPREPKQESESLAFALRLVLER
ncbi:MAG: hypothetical protein ACRDNW_01155 [Trebonia sp.]